MFLRRVTRAGNELPFTPATIVQRGGGLTVIDCAAMSRTRPSWPSKVPTLGYGVSYAIGNVLLAFWGTVIVALLA